MNDRTKTLTATANPTAKGFSAIVTTEVVDRDGDVMIAQGMNSKNYEANPILLGMHDDRKIPIGKCVSIRRKAGHVEMDFELTPRPANHVGEWEPEMYGAAIAFGSLKGVSIRFNPLAGGVRRANQADVQKYGEDCLQVYSKWELLEVSCVSIPANQEALIYAVAKAAKLSKVPAPVAPTRHAIPVRVPLIGEADVKSIIAEEFARATGKMWYAPIK